MQLDRRQLLRGALFVAAAPMIVKASSLMKVRALVEERWYLLGLAQIRAEGTAVSYDIGDSVWAYHCGRDEWMEYTII